MNSNSNNLESHDSQMYRNNLDSHANVAAFRRKCTTIRDTERCAQVEPFVLEHESLHKVLSTDTTIENYD